MRPVSAALTAAAARDQTDEVFVTLVTIAHEDFAAPARLCDDAVDTVSRGETYRGVYMAPQLPRQIEGEAPTARIEISVVDQSALALVRSVATPPSVTMEVVLASQPDVVEAAYSNFELHHVEYEGLRLVGQIGKRSGQEQNLLGVLITPGAFPATWRQS
jgi:hypothetical protein